MLRVLAFFLLTFLCFDLKAQDSLAVAEPDTVKKHSWKKACLFSAIVPGAGQVYNHIAMPKGKKKAFWKVPIIYAGLGVSTFFAVKNNSDMRAFRNEYEYRKVGNAPSNFFEYDSPGLLTLYGQSRTKRDFAILGMGIVYILNIIDAGVEAHFVNFDVSDDLSLSIQPAMFHSNSYGISLQFKFR